MVHGTLRGPRDTRAVSASRHGTAQAQASRTTSTCTRSAGTDRIRWYLDDALYGTVTPGDLRGKPWVFDHDFFLLINVAVGGTFSDSPDISVTLPQTMLIDYIRVYAIAAFSRPARCLVRVHARVQRATQVLDVVRSRGTAPTWCGQVIRPRMA